MLVNHLHTKLHTPSTNVSLLMDIKPKTKDTGRSTAIMAPPHSTETYLKKLACCPKYTTTSQVRASGILCC